MGPPLCLCPCCCSLLPGRAEHSGRLGGREPQAAAPPERRRPCTIRLYLISPCPSHCPQVFVGPFLRRSERSSDSEAKFTNVFVKNLDEGAQLVVGGGRGLAGWLGMPGFSLISLGLVWGAGLIACPLHPLCFQPPPCLRSARLPANPAAALRPASARAAVEDEELRAMFAEHGTVSSCIIMRDDEGKSKVRPWCGGAVAVGGGVAGCERQAPGGGRDSVRRRRAPAGGPNPLHPSPSLNLRQPTHPPHRHPSGLWLCQL